MQKITVPGPGDNITGEYLIALGRAILEQQALAIQAVRYPLMRAAGTLMAAPATMTLPDSGVFAVRVTMDGGTGGSASADCSYTYTVDDARGKLIARDVTPQTPRIPLVRYIAGSGWGWGCRDKTDAFVLLDAGEKEDKEVCAS